MSIPVVRANIHHDEIWAEENYLQGMAVIATGVLAALLVRRWPAPRVSTVRWTLAFGIVVVWAAVGAFDAAGANARMSFAWYLPALAGAWALGWGVARFVSQPLERRLVRSRESASRASLSAEARA